MQYELSEEACLRASQAFEEVLDSSVPPYKIAELHWFAEEDERFIQSEVRRRLYQPELPNGGDREREIIQRLLKLATNYRFSGAARADKAIEAWQKVLPPCVCRGKGCTNCGQRVGAYYTRQPLNPRKSKDEYNWYVTLRDSTHARRSWEQKWFAELMLGGLPKPVSNFAIECKFLLRDKRGEVVRFVILKNIFGAVSAGPHLGGCLELHADVLCAPNKFQAWARAKGPFNWLGGNDDLLKLFEDMARDTDDRFVQRIDSVGWHSLPSKCEGVPQTGIRFDGKYAYVNGRVIKPDEYGIIWHEGQGYLLCDKGCESTFVQSRPQMPPT